MHNWKLLLAGLAIIGSTGVAWSADSNPGGWMLAAGDGGCADLSVLRGKTLDLLAWQTPEEFVNHLRARNENVSTVTAKVEPGYMVKVVVPQRGIDVVFVPLPVCRAMWQEALRR